MKHYLLFVALAIIAVIIWVSFSPPPAISPAVSPTITPPTSVEQLNSTLPADSGSYLPHSDSVMLETQGSSRVLFFYANWCPTCRPVDAEISRRQAQLPAGLTVIRVNYNDSDTDEAERELAKKYAVTYQHTFVRLDENGNELSKWNGGGFDTIIQY